jgi:tetratricopeptide (TPR) repeat protein
MNKCIYVLVLVMISAVVLFPCCAAKNTSTAADLANIRVLMSKGKYDQARPIAEKAYRNNPADLQVRFYYATLLTDAAAAASEYLRIATDTAAPDTMRAIADTRLGQYYFVRSDFKRSALFYETAYGLKNDIETRIAWAQSLSNADLDGAAIDLLEGVATGSTVSSKKASFYLGSSYQKKKDCGKALPCFKRSIDGTDTCAWYPAALMGTYTCATAVNSILVAQDVRAILEQKYPRLVEQDMLAASQVKNQGFSETDVQSKPKDSATTDMEKKEQIDTIAKTEVDTPSFDQTENTDTYTLQVGSFTTMLNAKTLYNKLKSELPYTKIVEAVVKGVKYYRVRIGTFGSAAEAQQYADQEFRGRSISYKVVKE